MSQGSVHIHNANAMFRHHTTFESSFFLLRDVSILIDDNHIFAMI